MAMNSSGFLHAEWQILRSSPLSPAPIDLTAAAPGTIVHQFEVGTCSRLYSLIELGYCYTGDVGLDDPDCPGELIDGATLAQLQFQVEPANGGAPYLLTDDEGNAITFTLKQDASQGDSSFFSFDKYCNCPQCRAEEYPKLNACDRVNVLVLTQGVLGVQSIKVQLCYRKLGDPPCRDFVGQEICGEKFIGEGIPYPCSQAEGYPNYGKSCKSLGSPDPNS